MYPALHLVYKDDRGFDKYFLLRYIKFSEDTLARLVHDIRQQNPHVEIDDAVQKLIGSEIKDNR